MVDIDHLYPPSPKNVPPDLVEPPPSYRQRVVIVLFSLLAFLVIYLALMIGSAYLCYSQFASLGNSPPRGNANPYSRKSDDAPVLDLVIGLAAGLICLFLVKGLFRVNRFNPGVRLEVTEDNQPELVEFIRRVCRDTGAPFPHRIYLTPDVNAAVAFDESLLNLIVPTKKNLIIGLGLVNQLNLTEFKAVLAHEFGHFSQNSMKLGSYVYITNRIVADLVYRRDWFDDLLVTIRNLHLYIALFVWPFQVLLWLLRKALEGLFRLINFANSSLSRQMEYNADRVAVSVTGSDPLIFALARLDFAGETLGQAWGDLRTAADHQRYTRDLYFHQDRAVDYLRKKRNNLTLGEVPTLPDDPNQTVQVFKPEDTSVPAMWASHPSNYDRELNAKEEYIRGPVDERSAWDLFQNAEDVREQITRECYAVSWKLSNITLEDPQLVQEFIDAEHRETTYDPKYFGCYDNRYVNPGDRFGDSTQDAIAEFQNPALLAAAHDELFDKLEDRMKAHQQRLEEVNRLQPIAQGVVQLTNSFFEYRGEHYQQPQAKALLEAVEKELNQDYARMQEWDRSVYRVHAAMAAQLEPERRTLLDARYDFHQSMQEIHANVNAQASAVQNVLVGLQGQRQVAPHQFQEALKTLRIARTAIAAQLERAEKLRLPVLSNMQEGDSVRKHLLNDDLLTNLPADATSFEGVWVGRFFEQAGEILAKSSRLLFKSLGGILAIQEQIAADWTQQTLARYRPAPAADEVPGDSTTG